MTIEQNSQELSQQGVEQFSLGRYFATYLAKIDTILSNMPNARQITPSDISLLKNLFYLYRNDDENAHQKIYDRLSALMNANTSYPSVKDFMKVILPDYVRSIYFANGDATLKLSRQISDNDITIAREKLDRIGYPTTDVMYWTRIVKNDKNVLQRLVDCSIKGPEKYLGPLVYIEKPEEQLPNQTQHSKLRINTNNLLAMDLGARILYQQFVDSDHARMAVLPLHLPSVKIDLSLRGIGRWGCLEGLVVE